MSEILKTIADKMHEGKHREMAALVQPALDQGLPPRQVLDDGLLAGMDRVGCECRVGVKFIPEVMLSAKAMHAALEILRPRLAAADTPLAGKVVLGTVKGDIHDVGKKLVGIMLTGAGFQTIDLGTDVSPEKFVEAVKEKNANLVCLSALLTVTMPSMKTTIEALNKAGIRDRIKVMIGGAPVTQQYANEIGADGYGENANAAVHLARRLVGK